MEDNKMRIILENNERRVNLECSEHIDIYEMMQQVRGALIAWGFNPDSIIDGCEYIVEEYGKGLDEAQ